MNTRINNLLTFSRILFTPFVLIFLYSSSKILDKLGLALFVTIAITDLLDGYLARKWKTESKVGKMLDPLADKLMYISILVMLIDLRYLERNALWAVFTIMFREIFVMGVRTMSKPTHNIFSSKLSKIKTLVINCSVFLIMLNVAVFDSAHIGLHKFGHNMLYLGAILAILSSYRFFKIFFHLLNKGE